MSNYRWRSANGEQNIGHILFEMTQNEVGNLDGVTKIAANYLSQFAIGKFSV